MIKVLNFEGSLLTNAALLSEVTGIVAAQQPGQLLISVTALGRATALLERLAGSYSGEDGLAQGLYEEVRQYHGKFLSELFPDPDHPVHDDLANTFVEIEWILEDEPHPDDNFNYDQIVSIGHIAASKIFAAYLAVSGLKTRWVDSRGLIHTDNSYRNGRIDLGKSCDSIKKLNAVLEEEIVVVAGLTGGTSENFTTTLGSVGSDHSAAIFASCLQAEALHIWTDGPAGPEPHDEQTSALLESNSIPVFIKSFPPEDNQS